MDGDNIELNLKMPKIEDISIGQIDEESLDNLFETELLNTIDEYFPEGTNLSQKSLNDIGYIGNEKQSEKLSVDEEIEEFLDNLLVGNTQLGPAGFYILLVLYILVICIGTFGNVIVLIAISWKRSMRTPHNFFIAALAVSGMLSVMLHSLISAVE